jgi:hypothetical protein
MDYELSKNRNTATDIQKAKDQLHAARNKIKNMAALSLPAGKTKEDMEHLEKAKIEASDASKDAAEDDNPIDTSQLEITPVPSRPAVVLKWKEPSEHILRMREMAQQSGRQYKRRMARVEGKKPIVYRDQR